MYIDHTTLRTREIDKTKDFLVGVFGLKVGKRPDIIEQNIPGYWLYADDKPIVHIIGSAPRFQSTAQYAEAIDHTAFYLEDYDGFLNKLIELNIQHSKMELKDIGERRIFLTTPTGILLETVFRNK